MKRGISAIVSIILVVALTIVLFLLVSNWIQKDVLKDSIEKTGEKIEKQLDCNDISIELVDACVDNLKEASKIKLNVDVVGDSAVMTIVIKVIGKEDVVTLEYNAENAVSVPNRLLSSKEELSLDGIVNDVESIEVYPKTEKEDLCMNQMESTIRISSC